MNTIDSDTSRKLDSLDYQLSVIGSLGDVTQAALADYVARARAEERIGWGLPTVGGLPPRSRPYGFVDRNHPADPTGELFRDSTGVSPFRVCGHPVTQP